MPDNEFDDIGTILTNALAFRRSSFAGGTNFLDPIAAGEQVPGHVMFTSTEGRWFLRYESLPGIVAMKAVAVDVDGIYLETAPVPAKDLTEIIRKSKLPLRVSTDGTQIIASSSKQPVVIITRTTVDLEGFTETRELWTIPVGGLQDIHVQHAIRLADLVYTKNVYETGEEEPAGEDDGQPTMRMQLGFQQQLQMSQRPMLAQRLEQKTEQRLEQKTEQKLETTTEMRTEMRMELRQILALQYQILHMTEEELIAFATKDTTPTGQKRTLGILIFVLAGRVKNLKPALTWKEARRIARKSVYG